MPEPSRRSQGGIGPAGITTVPLPEQPFLSLSSVAHPHATQVLTVEVAVAVSLGGQNPSAAVRFCPSFAPDGRREAEEKD